MAPFYGWGLTTSKLEPIDSTTTFKKTQPLSPVRNIKSIKPFYANAERRLRLAG